MVQQLRQTTQVAGQASGALRGLGGDIGRLALPLTGFVTIANLATGSLGNMAQATKFGGEAFRSFGRVIEGVKDRLDALLVGVLGEGTARRLAPILDFIFGLGGGLGTLASVATLGAVALPKLIDLIRGTGEEAGAAATALDDGGGGGFLPLLGTIGQVGGVAAGGLLAFTGGLAVLEKGLLGTNQTGSAVVALFRGDFREALSEATSAVIRVGEETEHYGGILAQLYTAAGNVATLLGGTVTPEFVKVNEVVKMGRADITDLAADWVASGEAMRASSASVTTDVQNDWVALGEFHRSNPIERTITTVHRTVRHGSTATTQGPIGRGAFVPGDFDPIDAPFANARPAVVPPRGRGDAGIILDELVRDALSNANATNAVTDDFQNFRRPPNPPQVTINVEGNVDPEGTRKIVEEVFTNPATNPEAIYGNYGGNID